MQKLSKQSSDPRCFSKANQTYLIIFPLSSQGDRGTSWFCYLSWCRCEIGAEMLHIHLQKKAERFVAVCSEWAEVFRLSFWTWASLIQVWGLKSWISFFYVHISIWFDAYQLDLANVTQYGWDGREQKSETNTISQVKSAKLLIAIRITSLTEQVTEECPPVSKSRTEV